MEDSLAFHYYFTHKSGRKIIAQTSAEFFFMQGHGNGNKVPKHLVGADGKFEADPWRGRNHVRVGYKEWRNNPSTEQYQAEKSVEIFWRRCVGYEKLFTNHSGTPRDSRLSFGYYGCPLRHFLRNMANHAIMMGDREAYDKAISLHPQGNMLCLPWKE